jgi:hypothetical protein
MTVLEMKREMSRLNSRELKELHLHLLRLRHGTPEWRKSMARKMRAVVAGRFVTSEAIEKRIGRE